MLLLALVAMKRELNDDRQMAESEVGNAGGPAVPGRDKVSS